MSDETPKVSAWMSWEGGFDLVAMTSPELQQPNVIVHVARMVHTPLGRAAAGMILFAPDGMTPQVMGFVTEDETVGAYFGPNIFAGTPFESAPVLKASLEITNDDNWCAVRVDAGAFTIEGRMEGPGVLHEFRREAGDLPFSQSVLEATATQATLKINGEEVPLYLPEVGLGGGDPAVWSATGIYVR